jgi:putative nucleotidyltransferase with HDIG domain
MPSDTADAPTADLEPPRRRARLSHVLGALSYALDLTEGQPPGHSLRCCWIALRVADAMRLPPAIVSDLYYATLLKDAGCSSNAARLWQLYGGDERLAKRRYKSVNSQNLFALGGYVLRHAGAGEALRARIGRVLGIVGRADDLANELIHTRCERGADIARRIGFGETVAVGIHALDEHWNGRGRPEGLAGEAIPLIARIALLAQVVDVFHAIGGAAAALAETRRRAGAWFDPRVVAGLRAAAADPLFWPGLIAPDLDERVVALEPAARVILIDEDRLDDIAAAFAAVIDAKSSFTSGHSERVTVYADAIAAALGLHPAHRRWLRRAALLHDIGKLGVSNAILDKPGPLDAAEWSAIKRHAELSETILQRSRVFRDMAPVAAAHHERIDGTGYPRQLAGPEIPIEARIITTADIFDALTAARPYRGAMPVAEAIALMERDRGSAIDGGCLDALRRHLTDGGVALNAG